MAKKFAGLNAEGTRQGVSFADAANALITADKNLSRGANEAAIRDVFKRRGIFKN